MRGITIRIDRMQAIRIVGEAMRTKKQQFDKEKSEFPKKLMQARKYVAEVFREHIKTSQSCNRSKLYDLLNNCPIDHRKRREILPEEPELNLCREKQLLLMLQNDVRKVLPINSEHDLWAILQGKCEPIA